LRGLTESGSFDLAQHLGSPIVIYFYPKDATPACTEEARAFRDLAPAFEAAGARIIGVSRDSLKSHGRFRAKECLPFSLLSDESGTACMDWGVWKLKKLYGREYLGIVRSTFMVGRDGRVAAAWSQVKVAGHAEAVLAALRTLP
jgi:peroxiredoxin Q/BCP